MKSAQNTYIALVFPLHRVEKLQAPAWRDGFIFYIIAG
jgi:hypothetical protein